jgi:hypothetical protein
MTQYTYVDVKALGRVDFLFLLFADINWVFYMLKIFVGIINESN